jgi:hypothetical protein
MLEIGSRVCWTDGTFGGFGDVIAINTSERQEKGYNTVVVKTDTGTEVELEYSQVSIIEGGYL